MVSFPAAGWRLQKKITLVRNNPMGAFQNLDSANSSGCKVRLEEGSCVWLRPERANHVWSYDFVSSMTQDGRTLRLLVLIDEYARECLTIRVARREAGEEEYGKTFYGCIDCR